MARSAQCDAGNRNVDGRRCTRMAMLDIVSLVRVAIAILEQRFQLGRRIQILRPSRSAFGPDESRQIQTPAPAAEDIHVHGVGSEGIVVAAACDLSEQIDISNGARQPLEFRRKQKAFLGLCAWRWLPADGRHAGPAPCSFELSACVATSVSEKSFPLNNNGSSRVLARA